jgi:hypothetical protein
MQHIKLERVRTMLDRCAKETDLTLTRSGELEVTQVEGNTRAGVEFVDRWLYPENEMVVMDAGRIIIRDTTDLVAQAQAEGLTIEHEVVEAERSRFNYPMEER